MEDDDFIGEDDINEVRKEAEIFKKRGEEQPLTGNLAEKKPMKPLSALEQKRQAKREEKRNMTGIADDIAAL